MKNFIAPFLCGLFLAAAIPAAHSQCSGRYYDKIFPSFFNWQSFPLPTGLPTAQNPQRPGADYVVYGSAPNYSGVSENLDMYVFHPQGDTLEKRPLVILAFGGSFVIGAKESPDVIALCSELAARGFVTASIKYRIGVPTVDSLNMLKAVMRGVQDAKAAIRYFYKDAATVNKYRIDTNNIYMGGVSAGAFIGVHLGYIDDEAEMPQWLHDIAQTIGGFEGNSGNPGYSSKIRGVINLAGAIGDTSWIDADDPPMVSMHGTDDGTVPYCSEMIVRDGKDIIVADGSGTMKSRTANLGIRNPFFTHQGGGHVEFTNFFLFQPNLKPLVDTTIWFIRDFLYNELTGNKCGRDLRESGWLPAPCGVEVIETIDSLPVSVGTTPLSREVMAYPNPAHEFVVINKPVEAAGAVTIRIFDSAGKSVRQFSRAEKDIIIKRSEIGTGFFIFTMIDADDPSDIYRGKFIFTE